ncbi:hypothetical protein ACHAXA_002363 [Cyclostephanos tholiformis]|uniref:SAP domain-containing protein n=1 Tax=Cyclostephanos tholiformis TaxID=382380 RepID=A0ABD3SSE6_9STRA
MIARRIDAAAAAAAAAAAIFGILSSSSIIGCCCALLPSPPLPRHRHPVRHIVRPRLLPIAERPTHHRHRRRRRRRRPPSSTARWFGPTDDDMVDEDNDEALLESVESSTLINLCESYSLSSSGTKADMLRRLREYAEERAEEDRARRAGRARRVESNLEGKARHSIVGDDGGSFGGYDDDDDDEARGYFYYAAAETSTPGGKTLPTPAAAVGGRKSPSLITAPVLPIDVVPNANGERVVTIYSTSDRNDLTGATYQPGVAADFSLDSASQYRRRKGTTIDDIATTGEQDAAIGARRRGDAADSGKNLEWAKREISELVRNLLATTGAPAFQDNYDDDEDDNGDGGGNISSRSNAFASPYGFVGFDPDRVPPDVLSGASPALRAGDGRTLKEVLSEYELQAIGHDGYNADDRSKGGGHYRVVEEVGSFLEGYRKAEVRRIARETSTMMLDRLVKEGVKGLDLLLAGMAREGDNNNDRGGMRASSEGGELNGALVRYLEEAIRSQERRVKRPPVAPRVDDYYGDDGGVVETDLMWNVTRGEDGTMIETIDPNTPMVKRMLREELEKTTKNGDGGAGGAASDALLITMTVQEKILLLLKLLRDRVKVEAVVGNDAHARNLKLLAYALRAANDEERHSLILDELGHSLDALDVFSDLVTASLDYAEARSNDDFMPGDRRSLTISPVLDISKLQKIKVIVERIKTKQSWKASGGL